MANAKANHVFVSGIADDPGAQAAGEVLPSHWNADHTIAAGGSTTEVQVNSGGAIVGSPFFTFDAGQVAIGNASALGGGSLYGNYPPVVIDIEATYTVDPPSGYLQGLVSVIKSNFGAPSTASVYALYFKADNATANVVNSLYGVTGYATGNVTNVVVGGSFIGEATAGSPAQAIGAYCYAINIGLGTPALAAGLFVDSTTNSGGGSITNAYGITVADQTAGINNWSIKTGLGKVQFGDNLILGAVSSKTGVLQFANASSANLTSFQAGNAAAAVTYTLPTNVGNDTYMKCSAAGVLSWDTPTAALTLSNPYSQDSGSSAEIYFEYTNNTPGSMRFGLASGSGAGGIFTATTNNASVFGSHTNHLVEFYQNDTKRLTISSTTITSTLPIVGNLTGNADTVTVAAEGADTSCSLLFSTAVSGSLGPKTHADMTFNAATGVATFGQTIAGSITGNAATVSSANEATDTTCFPLFITASGTQTLAPKNNTSFIFNSNTGALGATTLELGGATDATLSYVGAGLLAVEGSNVLTAATGLPLAGGTMSGAITLGENTSLALDPAGSADGKYTGMTVTGTGGATIAFGDLVTLDKDDSRWELVDISVAAAATGDARGLLAIAVTSSTDGGALTVLLHGIIRADANFPALTIGAPVYASTTGDVVVAQPTTTDHVIRIVGYAMTADELYFNPGNSWTTHT